jgi:uncharacterized protein YndB with AHSA1/START domain
MPKVGRSRVIDADSGRTWELVSDPHHLPRWWPLAQRVEDVHEKDGRMRWTLALRSDRGTQVRADYTGGVAVEGHRFAWDQQVEGTPFERILRSASVEIAVATAGDRDEKSLVSVSTVERLRGLSRLGSPMMRSAAGKRLEEALENLERALGGSP